MALEESPSLVPFAKFDIFSQDIVSFRAMPWQVIVVVSLVDISSRLN